MNQNINNEFETNNLPPKPNFISMNEIIDQYKTAPPIPYLWSGIKEGTFGFIFGPAKSGKTIFCENLALKIAYGDNEFFERSISNSGQKVLFISLEEFWQPRTERLNKQIFKFGYMSDNYLAVNETFPRQLNSTEQWVILKDTIISSGAKIVFIDSLTRMYNGVIEESSTSKIISLKLREITNDLKITLIVIHHSTKLNGRALTLDNVAGSRVLAQEADFIIGINKTIDGVRYLKDISFRYAPENSESVYTFSIDENLWLNPINQVSESSLIYASDGRISDDNKMLIYEKMLLWSKKMPEIPSKLLIEELVDSKIMSRDTLFSNLTKLQSEGKIFKSKKGLYKLVD